MSPVQVVSADTVRLILIALGYRVVVVGSAAIAPTVSGYLVSPALIAEIILRAVVTGLART